MPFVASSRHRPAGPGVAGWGPGLRGGVQCRAKPEAGYELYSLYSLAGPTSMATCLLCGNGVAGLLGSGTALAGYHSFLRYDIVSSLAPA